MIQINIEVFCNEISQLIGVDEQILFEHIDTNLFGPPFYYSAEEILYLYFVIKQKFTIKMNSLTNETFFFTSVRQMYAYIN